MEKSLELEKGILSEKTEENLGNRKKIVSKQMK